jgi:hypothetical protein
MNSFVECPHCTILIEILELNCRIFRCGIHKKSLKQIGQHLPKNECDSLFKDKKIYGCGKPFIVETVNSTTDELTYKAFVCDYI